MSFECDVDDDLLLQTDDPISYSPGSCSPATSTPIASPPAISTLDQDPGAATASTMNTPPAAVLATASVGGRGDLPNCAQAGGAARAACLSPPPESTERTIPYW